MATETLSERGHFQLADDGHELTDPSALWGSATGRARIDARPRRAVALTQVTRGMLVRYPRPGSWVA